MLKKWVFPVLFILLGLFLGGFGLYVGHTDDSPGAGGLGLLLALLCCTLALRRLRRNRKP